MSWKYEWKLRISTIFWFIGIILFLLSIPILLGFSLWAFAVVALMSSIITIIVCFIVWIVTKRRLQVPFWWIRCFMAISILSAFPVYYLASITQFNPVLIPQITMTNGQKTIIFQGMQHVATEGFYKSVVYDLENSLSQDYVFLYEGVKPSTPEIDKWFETLITGGESLVDSYELMGSICGLKFQNNYFMRLQKDMLTNPTVYVIADVDTRELKQEYERLVETDTEFARTISERQKPQQDQSTVVEELIERLRNGSTSQKQMAGILCRGIMTLVLTKKSSSEADQQLDKLILNFRNKKLYESITTQSENKIYVMYGFEHFKGTYQLLKAEDPRWQIMSVKWMRTIDGPQEYQGNLSL